MLHFSSVTGLRKLADSEGGVCIKVEFEPNHIYSLICDKISSRGSACSSPSLCLAYMKFVVKGGPFYNVSISQQRLAW